MNKNLKLHMNEILKIKIKKNENKIILISIFVIILVFIFKNSFSILLKDNLSQKNKDFIVNNFLIFKKIERLEREISNKINK